MKPIQYLALMLMLVPSLALADDGEGTRNYFTEEVVVAESVPERVMEAARSAKPGAYFTRIKRKLKRNDEFYYYFDASQVGRYWVIVVRTDGKLMEVYEETSPPRSFQS